MKTYHYLPVITLASLVLNQVHATDYSASYAVSVNWSALTWTPAGTPAEGDKAIVTRTGGNLTVDQAVTIAHLDWITDTSTINSSSGNSITFSTGDSSLSIVRIGRGSATGSSSGRAWLFDAELVLNNNLQFDWYNPEKRGPRLGSVISDGANGAAKLTIRYGPTGVNGGGSGDHRFDLGLAGGSPNTHSGGTTITTAATAPVLMANMRKVDALGSGLLTFGANTNSTTLQLNGFSQSVRGVVSTTTASIASTVANTPFTIRLVNGGSPSFAGKITGANVALIIDKATGSTGTGVQTFTGTSTGTGPTTINAATLALTGTGALGSDLITVNSGGTLDVSGVTGGWSLGATQALAGAGTVAGDFTANGIVSPGSPGGTLTATGNVTFASGGALGIALNPQGAPQIETATAAGTADEDGGIVVVTVTGAGFEPPVVLNVAVAGLDTPDLWADKVRVALAADATVTALYTVGGSGPDITLTRTVPADYDPALNIALGYDIENDPFTQEAPVSADTATGGPPSVASLAVGGALDITAGTLNLAITGTLTDPVYVLASYGSLVPAAGPFAAVNGAIPAGYTLDYAYQGNKVALVSGAPADPFGDWISKPEFGLAPADRDPGDDPDKDGKPNIVEFALDSNPALGSARGKVFVKTATVGGTPGVLTLTAAVRSGASFAADGNNRKAVVAADGLTYVVEAANTLLDWGTPVVGEVTDPGDLAAIQAGLPAADGGWVYKTFATDGSAPSDPAEFIRVKVTSP